MKKIMAAKVVMLALLLGGCGNAAVGTVAGAEKAAAGEQDAAAAEGAGASGTEEGDAAGGASKEEDSAGDGSGGKEASAGEMKEVDAESAAEGGEAGSSDSGTTPGDKEDGTEAGENEAEESRKPQLADYEITVFGETEIMYASDPVNIRKGPAVDFDRVGGLKRGQEVTVTGQADTGWYEIAYGEDKAYVSGRYLQKEKPVEETDIPASDGQEAAQAQNAAGGQAGQQDEAAGQAQAVGNQAQVAENQAAAQGQAAEAQAAGNQVAAQGQAAENQAAEAQATENQAAAQGQAAEAQTAENQAAENQAAEAQPAVPEVRNVAGVIMVGDSRFVQMQQNIGENSCTWIAEGGKGYTWFNETAVAKIDGCVGKGSKVLINLGVNDPGHVNDYLALVNAKAAEWAGKGATVYYASVNPVWDNPYTTEEQVEYFNSQMQAGLSGDVHWIDSHSYLTSIGYKLVDGLHFNAETYQNLYAYFMSCL